MIYTDIVALVVVGLAVFWTYLFKDWDNLACLAVSLVLLFLSIQLA
jgi:ABC-type siderophore export system fused ATPase/permease subunit